MIDLQVIDKMYEAGKASGNLMTFAIFDKRLLMPLSQLPSAVAKETAESTTEDELRAKAGWEGDEDGAPLYVPSRVGLFLKLEREGYGADELRLIVNLETLGAKN